MDDQRWPEEMHCRYGRAIYGRYGFLDAFNPTLVDADGLRHSRIDPGIGWVDRNHLGIDQGPILAMPENHDSRIVWKVMRRNRHFDEVSAVRASAVAGWTARIARGEA